MGGVKMPWFVFFPEVRKQKNKQKKHPPKKSKVRNQETKPGKENNMFAKQESQDGVYCLSPPTTKNIENEAQQNLTPWVTWCLLVPCWGGYSMDEIVGRNCRFLVDPVSWPHQILTDKNRNDIVAMMGSLVMAYRIFVFLIFTVHLQLQIDANLIISLLGNWFSV